MTEFVQHLEEHFDLVAVTDHMKCEYAGHVSNATARSDGLIVLPGMEVNFRGEAALSLLRLHLLVILPEGTSPEGFSQLFTGMPAIPADDGQRNGQEEVTDETLKNFISTVHALDGICIAAHVNTSQGIRHRFRQTSREILELVSDDSSEVEEGERAVADSLKDYLHSVGFDAIEVSKASDQRHYRWYSTRDGKEISLPVTFQNDAHCIEEFARADKITWIKMTNVGIDGLRKALKSPETRIRFASDLPTPPNPRLLGMEIVGDANSLFENAQIAFAENLNCLIGPRGSGKSTLVEALRYVFGYNLTLDELDSANKLSERIRDMQKANLSGCLIRVVYQTKDRERRVIEATYDPQEDYATKVFDEEGEPISIANLESSRDYPLRLFGWSEIEILGREAARQRDLLDRLIPDLADVRREREEIRANLRANRIEVEAIVNDLKETFARDNALITRYGEHKEAFDKLNTEHVKESFSALDLAQGKKRILARVEQNVGALGAKIKELGPASVQSGVNDLLEEAEKELSDWWLSTEMASLRVVDVETDVQKHLDAAVGVLNTFGALLTQHLTQAGQEIEAIHSQIRESFADDSSLQRIADLRANAERRLREAKAVRDEYLANWKRLENLLAQRQATADSLVACQQRIAGVRAESNAEIELRLNRFLGEEMKISLRFIPNGDKRVFIDSINKIAASIAKQYKLRSIPQLLGENFNPITLARVYYAGDAKLLEGKSLRADAQTAISEADARKSVASCHPFDKNEHAGVKCLIDGGERLTVLMKMEEVEWDDDVSILLNDRPVSELSPGQRSSAMLPLIALSETTPLVIDQPEDNLDNKLVGRVLTDILAALKEKRQIIVCTHNPNIVVSGDAEQVIVLEAVSDRKAKVAAHGSIDNDDIVKSVIDIMEGGTAAFLARKERYDL